MGLESKAGGSESRFVAYVEAITQALGHADRATPFRSYCAGLLLPGDRKSVEPMAARVQPGRVQAAHQSLHHFVAKADWSDEAVLAAVRGRVLPVMRQNGPIRALIVDDTGIPKKGTHSVGVARQYCGQPGKQDNCQVAVSLSAAHVHASLPLAYRLYLPHEWTDDPDRRALAGVPDEIVFQTKPQIALDQLRAARAGGIEAELVLADAGYGNDTDFRDGITAIGLAYAVGIQSSTTLWPPGVEPLPAKPWSRRGRPTSTIHRDAQHQPVSAKQLALALPAQAWRRVTWREGTNTELASRFAAVRVRPAHRDYQRSTPRAEEWCLIEWPADEPEPTKYFLSTLPASISRRALVAATKLRWRIERDYQDLEPELAGETVTLWWGLFDQELFIEFEGKRFGPYQPSRGAIPLYRYRKYQKSRVEERLDKVVRLADQLGLPRAALSGGDRPLPSLPPGAASTQVARTPFPEPTADITFPTPLAARLAISVQLCKPLGSLPEPDRAFIDALLAETLDRNAVAVRVREHFRTAGRG